MNEIEKKELKKLEKVIANVHPFYVETIAEELIKEGYGKVEDYKKEIEWLKKDLKESRFLHRSNFEMVKILQEKLKGYSKLKEENIKLEKTSSDRFSKEELDQRISFAEQQAIKKFAQQLIENQSCHIVMCQTICYISEDDVRTLLEVYGIGE